MGCLEQYHSSVSIPPETVLLCSVASQDFVKYHEQNFSWDELFYIGTHHMLCLFYIPGCQQKWLHALRLRQYPY